eukprot:scaffold31981_cov22-Prasinocladus_malaysianus.AAC.1
MSNAAIALMTVRADCRLPLYYPHAQPGRVRARLPDDGLCGRPWSTGGSAPREIAARGIGFNVACPSIVKFSLVFYGVRLGVQGSHTTYWHQHHSLRKTKIRAVDDFGSGMQSMSSAVVLT